MNSIFPYIGNNNPNWLSYFSEGLKPPTSLCWFVMCLWVYDVSMLMFYDVSWCCMMFIGGFEPTRIGRYWEFKVTNRFYRFVLTLVYVSCVFVDSCLLVVLTGFRFSSLIAFWFRECSRRTTRMKNLDQRNAKQPLAHFTKWEPWFQYYNSLTVLDLGVPQAFGILLDLTRDQTWIARTWWWRNDASYVRSSTLVFVMGHFVVGLNLLSC
jgi:hypothetical protein